MSAFWIILGLFGLPIPLYELFPRSLSCWRILPFPRTPLHYLLPLVNSEVISILPQRSSQALYWYDQFCFHKYKILFSKYRAPDVNQRKRLQREERSAKRSVIERLCCESREF